MRTLRSRLPHRDSKSLMLAVLGTGQVTVILAATGLNVALPQIQADLGMNASTLQYVMTVYGAVLGGFLLFGGRCADLFGRRRMLLVGIALFTASSVVAGLANTTATLLVARGIEGLGGAFITTAALSMLTVIYPQGAERNHALALWGALTGAAGTTAVIIGGILTEGPGWRWLFWMNIPVGIAAWIVARVVLPRGDVGARPKLDLPGAVLLTSGLLILIAGIARAEGEGWFSPVTIGTLAISVLVLGGFVLVERRTEEPLIDFTILRLSSLRGANTVALLLFGGMFALYYIASLLMQQVLGYTAFQAGVAYLPLGIALVVGAQIASRLLARLHPRRLLIGTLLGGALGFVMLARIPADGSYVVDLLPPFVVLGIAFGMVVVLVQVLAFTGVRERESGVAAGLINTTQEIGGALGTAVLSTVAAAATAGSASAPDSVDALLDGFRVALFVGAGLMVLAAICTQLMFRGAVIESGAAEETAAQPENADGASPRTPGE